MADRAEDAAAQQKWSPASTNRLDFYFFGATTIPLANSLATYSAIRPIPQKNHDQLTLQASHKEAKAIKKW
jgi:hypothetical protein